MKKIALVAALVAGFATAAVADDASPDYVRNYGPIAGQHQQVMNAGRHQQVIEGRNVYSPTAPKTFEELWFERASAEANG
jgi:hypothetical protein